MGLIQYDRPYYFTTKEEAQNFHKKVVTDDKILFTDISSLIEHAKTMHDEKYRLVNLPLPNNKTDMQPNTIYLQATNSNSISASIFIPEKGIVKESINFGRQITAEMLTEEFLNSNKNYILNEMAWQGHIIYSDYNELLVRSKFEGPTWHVAVFEDSLIPRLCAQMLAVDLQANLGENYIPITCYIPDKIPPIFAYCKEERQADLAEALSGSDVYAKMIAKVINYCNNNKLPIPPYKDLKSQVFNTDFFIFFLKENLFKDVTVEEFCEMIKKFDFTQTKDFSFKALLGYNGFKNFIDFIKNNNLLTKNIFKEEQLYKEIQDIVNDDLYASGKLSPLDSDKEDELTASQEQAASKIQQWYLRYKKQEKLQSQDNLHISPEPLRALRAINEDIIADDFDALEIGKKLGNVVDINKTLPHNSSLLPRGKIRKPTEEILKAHRKKA